MTKSIHKIYVLLCLLLHKITRYPFILKVNILPMFSEMITATESISLQFLSSLFRFAGTANPSILKLYNLPGYFFDGDINDPNVLQSVKVNFMNLATEPYIPPIFCKEKPDECNVKTIEVYHK